MRKHLKKLMLAVLCISAVLLLSSCAKSDAAKYTDAQKLLTQGKYAEAVAAFTEIENYEDSSKYIMYIKAIQFAEGGEFDMAITSLRSLKDFKDSELMATYYTARRHEAEQRYAEALEIYKTIATFRDSVKRESAFPKWWKLTLWNTFIFGNYEQDNNASNGKEPIQWRVLKREGAKALLIAEMNLDCQPYNKEQTYVTWEVSTLRAWLNGTFLNEAFKAEEQKAILTTALQNEDNPEYKTDGGNPTQDRVFLLSIAEAETLFRDDASRVGKNTAYADAQGAYTIDSGAGWWWLRSPGSDAVCAGYVRTSGSVPRYGDNVSGGSGAVRPALWLNLTTDIFSSETP